MQQHCCKFSDGCANDRGEWVPPSKRGGGHLERLHPAYIFLWRTPPPSACTVNDGDGDTRMKYNDPTLCNKNLKTHFFDYIKRVKIWIIVGNGWSQSTWINHHRLRSQSPSLLHQSTILSIFTVIKQYILNNEIITKTHTWNLTAMVQKAPTDDRHILKQREKPGARSRPDHGSEIDQFSRAWSNEHLGQSYTICESTSFGDAERLSICLKRNYFSVNLSRDPL